MASPTVLDGYPQPMGNKKVAVFYHKGPNPYVALVVAAPPTGGDMVTDIECGMRYLEFVNGGISDNGQYRVEAVPFSGNPSQAPPNSGTIGAAQRNFKLRWEVISTGAEVAAGVDLSGRTVRLFAIGSK